MMRYVYPDGKAKALTFSYDDGQHYDRRLVEIFNQYGMKATFHLNSGTLGNIGGGAEFIAKDELNTLYKGHEIASHGVDHKNMPALSETAITEEIYEDRKALEYLTGKMVCGFSYAFGNYTKRIEEIAKASGIKYARTVNSTGGFFPPADFLEWHPTCHHGDNLSKRGDDFLNVPDYVELPLMYIWGHSFEFGRENNWEIMEEFCAKMSGKDDIWYATNIQICEYLMAIRSLEFSTDGSKVYNPTCTTVWAKNNGVLVEIQPGGITII